MEYWEPGMGYLEGTEASGWATEQLRQGHLGSESKDPNPRANAFGPDRYKKVAGSFEDINEKTKDPGASKVEPGKMGYETLNDPLRRPHEGANLFQHGGNHYKTKIEPWDAIADWELTFLDGNAIKYIARWQKKGGVEDLKKAIHYLQKLIETVEGKK